MEVYELCGILSSTTLTSLAKFLTLSRLRRSSLRAVTWRKRRIRKTEVYSCMTRFRQDLPYIILSGRMLAGWPPKLRVFQRLIMHLLRGLQANGLADRYPIHTQISHGYMHLCNLWLLVFNLWNSTILQNRPLNFKVKKIILPDLKKSIRDYQ